MPMCFVYYMTFKFLDLFGVHDGSRCPDLYWGMESEQMWVSLPQDVVESGTRLHLNLDLLMSGLRSSLQGSAAQC